MSTPLSSATSYCTPAQALMYHDARQWGDWLKDDDTRESATNILSDATMQEALNNASGIVESACTVAQRYSPSDLNLILSANGMSAALIRGLVAEIAFFIVMRRRRADAEAPPSVVDALALLERIRLGEAVFGILEVMQAGNPTLQALQANDYQTLNLANDQAAPYFGRRAKWQRISGGVPLP
jgi:hypothetical protein